MPFEFTGAPPALLDSSDNTSSSFKSFSKTAVCGLPSGSTTPTATAYGFRSIEAPASFGTPKSSQSPPSSFGQARFSRNTVSLGTTAFGRNVSLAASFGLPSTFGMSTLLRATAPTFRAESAATQFGAAEVPFSVYNKCVNATDALWVSQASTPTIRGTPLSANYPTEEISEEDTFLTRALKRAAKSRPAIFGRSEVAADSVLRDVFALNEADAPKLLTELDDLQSSAPEVAAFVQSLFGHAIKTKDPGASLERAKSINHALGNGKGDTIKKHKKAPTKELTVSRVHACVIEAEDMLRDEFLDYELVAGSEAAKVLADYVLDRFYELISGPSLKKEIAGVLGLDEVSQQNVNLGAILNSVESRLLYAEEHFGKANAKENHVDKGQGNSGSAEATHKLNKVKASGEGNQQEQIVATRKSAAATSIQSDKNIPEDVNQPEKASISTGSEAAPPTDSNLQGFRFLNLPAELRNWVYTELLAPCGYICLTNRDWSNFGGKSCAEALASEDVSSGADISILSTNRQIHEEAKSILYRENTLVVVGVVSINIHPFISRSVLPDNVLPLLGSVTLICDHRPNEAQGGHWYHRVNWTQLQAMKSLKYLRICMIEREEQRDENFSKQLALHQILERIPADCEVSFGPKETFEEESIQEAIELSDDRVAARKANWGYAFSVDGELLKTLAEDAKNSQGRKSGHKRDYRFAEKPVTKTLQELIAAGEVDPTIVLGGSQ